MKTKTPIQEILSFNIADLFHTVTSNKMIYSTILFKHVVVDSLQHLKMGQKVKWWWILDLQKRNLILTKLWRCRISKKGWWILHHLGQNAFVTITLNRHTSIKRDLTTSWQILLTPGVQLAAPTTWALMTHTSSSSHTSEARTYL